MNFFRFSGNLGVFMALDWIREEAPARWDSGKIRIVGQSPAGTFDLPKMGEGDIVPGDWWRVEDGGEIVGYGWMDVVWGDAEILLAVDPGRRRQGIGNFILENLEAEAKKQGLNYLFNVVPAKHPDPEGISAWLAKRHFVPSAEDRLSRRVIGKAS